MTGCCRRSICRRFIRLGALRVRRRGSLLHLWRIAWPAKPLGGAGVRADFWLFLLFLGSAISRWRAGDAPVRGGTYFSLQRQRKVGKRKPLTPLTPVQTSNHQLPQRTKKCISIGAFEYPGLVARIGGVSPLSLLTFFAAA